MVIFKVSYVYSNQDFYCDQDYLLQTNLFTKKLYIIFLLLATNKSGSALKVFTDILRQRHSHQINPSLEKQNFIWFLIL